VERIGGQCAAIAKLVPLCGHRPVMRVERRGRVTSRDKLVLEAIERMGRLALSLVIQARETFTTSRVSLLHAFVSDGAAAGRLNGDLLSQTVAIADDPRACECAMFMILIGRCMERIVENFFTVAEQTIVVVSGSSHAPGDLSQLPRRT
jgi:phosphate uptake regulator